MLKMEEFNMNDKIPVGSVRNFIFGGNANFTIQSEKTGTHYTYKVKRSKKNSSVFFICISDDYVGYLRFKGEKIYYNQGMNFEVSVRLQKQVKALLWVIANSDKLDGNVTVYHCGRCACCGRKLTDPESIERGFGPECFKRLYKKELCLV